MTDIAIIPKDVRISIGTGSVAMAEEIGQAVLLLRSIADNDTCPVDVRDAAEDCSQRLDAALKGKAADHA